MTSLASHFAQGDRFTRSLEVEAIPRDIWLSASLKYVDLPRNLCLTLPSSLNVEHDLLASRFARGCSCSKSLDEN